MMIQEFTVYKHSSRSFAVQIEPLDEVGGRTSKTKSPPRLCHQVKKRHSEQIDTPPPRALGLHGSNGIGCSVTRLCNPEPPFRKIWSFSENSFKSYGCKILDKFGSCPNDFQNLNTTVTFFKNGLQLVGSRGYF